MSQVSSLSPAARWLWSPSAHGANHYVEFVRELDSAGAEEAWLQLSAETSYRLWINGRAVHAGPPREVPPYFYFDTIDLRPWLQAGRNELRIVAHHQGEDSQSYQAGTPALLLAGRWQAPGGEACDLGAPAGWRCRRLTRYRADTHRLFSCVGFSEWVDFAAPESPWTEPVVVATHPWAERPRALARDLPLLRETVRRAPGAPVRGADGVWLYDLGEEVSGYVEWELRSSRRLSLVLSYAEALDAEGRVDATKGGMNYRDRLELPAGATVTWRSHEKRAFRYLALEGADAGGWEAEAPRVIETCWPYEPRWRAVGGSPLARRIREVSARTIELNTEDLLTDCPWRERAQYLDCQFYMGAMARLFGTLEPIRRFLHQFPRGADATGLLRMCYPSPAGTTVIPDFSLSYAVLLLRYLKLGGDLETVRANLPLAVRGVEAFREREDADGLLVDVPGWIFLDNTFELPKQPRSAGLNAVYHGGHRALAELLRACGELGRAAEMDVRAERIRAAFRRLFLRDGRLLDSDSTPDHERHRQWIYHHGPGKGGSFRLAAGFRKAEAAPPLRLAVHGGARAWIDGVEVVRIAEGGSWISSAIYQPVTLPTPADTGWHSLELEVEWSGIDWECFVSSLSDLEWREVRVDGRPAELRPNPWPWLTQTTVGYAAYHGLLEPEEARAWLRACLPASYEFPYAKRTTPFFAAIGRCDEARRILPCNVPASLFHFCHALRQHGMAREARELLLPIYAGMLERGATTWWEEWNTGSSLCHAWGSFVVEFLDEAD
jgi:hypothetical protein